MHYVFVGLDTVPPDIHVFHAGTAYNSSKDLVTSGGRVLAVVALDPSLKTAALRALDGVSHIQFDGAYFRKDIAHTAFTIR